MELTEGEELLKGPGASNVTLSNSPYTCSQLLDF